MASVVTIKNGGTLQLLGNAKLPNTTISIQSGGVLDASQATSGLTINAGQTLSIGRTGSAAPICWAMRRSAECSISAAARGTIAALTSTNTLALSSGTVDFDLTNIATSNSGTNDTVSAANLSLTGTTTLNINPVNLALGNGNYNLFTFSGNLSGGTSNFNLVGVNSNGVRQAFALVTSGTSNAAVQLAVTGNAANLLWTGTAGSAWDLTTTPNWSNLSSGGSADVFYNNDLVTFSDSGSTGNVVLSGSLSPGAVAFTNSAFVVYPLGNWQNYGQHRAFTIRHGNRCAGKRQRLHRGHDDQQRYTTVRKLECRPQ